LRCALQYFLKTGTCKYGSTCKYHHPKDRRGAAPVSFNTLGLPMRQVCSSLCTFSIFIIDYWSFVDKRNHCNLSTLFIVVAFRKKNLVPIT